MNVSPDHERDLMSMSDERKWKLIKNDVFPHNFIVGYLCRYFYLEVYSPLNAANFVPRYSC